jgi:hypothetical protein
MMFIDCRMVVAIGIGILMLWVTLQIGEVEVNEDDDE